MPTSCPGEPSLDGPLLVNTIDDGWLVGRGGGWVNFVPLFDFDWSEVGSILTSPHTVIGRTILMSS